MWGKKTRPETQVIPGASYIVFYNVHWRRDFFRVEKLCTAFNLIFRAIIMSFFYIYLKLISQILVSAVEQIPQIVPAFPIWTETNIKHSSFLLVHETCLFLKIFIKNKFLETPAINWYFWSAEIALYIFSLPDFHKCKYLILIIFHSFNYVNLFL